MSDDAYPELNGRHTFAGSSRTWGRSWETKMMQVPQRREQPQRQELPRYPGVRVLKRADK